MPNEILLSFLCCFLLSAVLAPLFLRIARRIKIGQPILSYVEQHSGKQGTPTMGGFIFLIPAAVTSLIFGVWQSKVAAVVLVGTLAYMTVGFLDDYIKIHFKENKGLKPYQKIIAQLAIAFALSWFNYKNFNVGDGVYIPFLKQHVSFSWWYVPFCMTVYLAATNAVNLTDGLDGLAASSSSVYMLFFLIIGVSVYSSAQNSGSVLYAAEIGKVNVFIASLIGGLLLFLILNANPAKIFMGDTGSLALGGAAASVATVLRQPLIILTVGAVFVWSALSVIIQVAVFRIKKKRVFLMAPFHHHLELKGMSESKIAVLYSAVTALMGAVTLLII